VEEKLDRLKKLLGEVFDLNCAASLLGWDQNTYMPPGGGPARARQLSLLRRLAHERFISDEIGRLLEDLRPYEEGQPYESDGASLIRVTRRQYERAVKIPPEFAAERAAHGAASHNAWVKARPKNDFPAVRPFLEKTLDLSRQLADFYPGYEHIADPLIDFSDYGMKVSDIRPVFEELREGLVPLVEEITSKEPPDDSFLHQNFSEKKQLDFGLKVIKEFGYDFERGREDKSPHPFTTKFSLGDVRITTRVLKKDMTGSLFATMHEAGHAMYEQGVERSFEGTPLARGTSAGVHESQSRLWENLVGRSRGFWKHYYPKLQKVFPKQLDSVDMESFYRAVNRVKRSLIRVYADEMTYNLHVMIRFGLELDMLEGKLPIADLPEAWNARYTSDIGITPPDDKDGVMQDIHWYGGGIGGSFQGYTLGNIMNAQFYEAALAAHPEIPSEVEEGRFGTLFDWLKENIWRHGKKFTASELLERVTGGPLSVRPLLSRLKQKFGEIYGF
jgi:carboxypeptidase Taq